MQPVRNRFQPDPTMTREDMEALQHDIAEAADFSTDPTLERPVASLSVAGIDQAFLETHAISAVVVMADGAVVEEAVAIEPVETPYIPGLLAFREGGPIVSALGRLEQGPDVLLVDGNGRIHHRQAGLATHIGVLFDAPSVGVAKRLLCGRLEDPPAQPFPVDTRVRIVADEAVEAPNGTLLGYAVQTRQFESSNRSINPVYVSPGHRIDASRAADIVLETTTGYKLPEPIRLADALADRRKAEITEEE